MIIINKKSRDQRSRLFTVLFGRGAKTPELAVPRSSPNHSCNIRLLLRRGGFGHFPAHIHIEEDPLPGLVDP